MSYPSFLTTKAISEWQYDCLELCEKIRCEKLCLCVKKDMANLTPEEYSTLAHEFAKLDEFQHVILNLFTLDE
ncbi:hypothetical protein QJ854_gp150 [Moumouvirus goulette]|uniref:Uncharacterized protein n=1 Tax=Moumouvirus goulette TaxID=1247379 RepID=M1PXX3_9VIRU|nr:hypothetical protein QJ854_gp150 [Moumouvirus goulette]AGF85632.1 hypothetical protein glt_00827 [Moumouvirus goulette]